MSRSLILLALVLAVAQCSFLRSHEYWYTATRSAVEKNIPFADIPWGYCDMKCTYLEQVAKKSGLNVDFQVVWFTESTFKPDFAACYAVKGTEYTIWSKVVSNAYYKTNCGDGDDGEDYYALTKGTDPKYKVTKTEGAGIGKEINY